MLILNPDNILAWVQYKTVRSKLNKDLMCNTITYSDIWVEVIPLCTKLNCGAFVLFIIKWKLYRTDLYNNKLHFKSTFASSSVRCRTDTQNVLLLSFYHQFESPHFQKESGAGLQVVPPAGQNNSFKPNLMIYQDACKQTKHTSLVLVNIWWRKKSEQKRDGKQEKEGWFHF